MTSGTAFGREVKGSGLRVLINAISPSLLPFQDLDPEQSFPTSLFISLFGQDEDWFTRGEQVGGALLRELHLSGSMNTERALRETARWFAAHHPGATEVRVEQADYRGAEILLHLDYPAKFLQGILERITWGTRGREVRPNDDDPYRFIVRY